jgi:histidyl-tRNA synthetase
MINVKWISWFEDKLPEYQLLEEKFKEIIRRNYSLSWFTPLDTPNIERVEVLTSKWADDNEIYWIKRLKAEWKEANDFEMWLRFDLTVPLARYVWKYEWEISFPFKRQQIARVYRWERPQKGRYREFYQADIDIIWNGKLPLFADVEILSTINNSLKELDFWEFVININNKKLLAGFLESLEIENIVETIWVIDKKDKVNREKLISMLEWINLWWIQIDSIFELIDFSKKKTESIDDVFKFFDWITNNMLDEWLEELEYIYDNLLNLWVEKKNLIINPTISRGLNYYTWLVFETFISGAENMWSISSWWRYDDLCNHFSKNSFPGVWGSIGLSRLLSVLNELKKIQINKKTISDVLLLNLWNNILKENLALIKTLRDNWINSEIYLDSSVKFAKQIKYADNKKIPFVIIYWQYEIENDIVQIKNLSTWEQKEINISNIIKTIKK